MKRIFNGLLILVLFGIQQLDAASLIEANAFAYTGQALNYTTGLMVMGGYRAYSPNSGTFLKQDAYSAFQGQDTFDGFNYAAGNPVIFSDPSGHLPTWSKWVLGLLGSGVFSMAGGLVWQRYGRRQANQREHIPWEGQPLPLQAKDDGPPIVPEDFDIPGLEPEKDDKSLIEDFQPPGQKKPLGQTLDDDDASTTAPPSSDSLPSSAASIPSSNDFGDTSPIDPKDNGDAVSDHNVSFGLGNEHQFVTPQSPTSAPVAAQLENANIPEELTDGYFSF